MQVDPAEPPKQPSAEYIRQLYNMGASEETIRLAVGPPRVGCHLYRGSGELYPQPVAEVLTGRHVAQLRAKITGFFFLPCPLCGQEFAGYEWREQREGDTRLEASIPAPDGPQNMSMGICPACTRAGRGYVNPLMLAEFDRLREEFFLAHPELEEPQ